MSERAKKQMIEVRFADSPMPNLDQNARGIGVDNDETRAELPWHLFAHGVAEQEKGTCVTMAVMWKIAADKLGWPMHLRNAPTHLYLAWDDGQYLTNPSLGSRSHRQRQAGQGRGIPAARGRLGRGVQARSLHAESDTPADPRRLCLDTRLSLARRRRTAPQCIWVIPSFSFGIFSPRKPPTPPVVWAGWLLGRRRLDTVCRVGTAHRNPPPQTVDWRAMPRPTDGMAKRSLPHWQGNP